ncbi:hypothetical protein GCM10020367_25920 [Streptomyces sannanensis]|uniref:Uncharacterized protein n=1 Tax=Streptomyces sannanensis TaxID=285536 RepID=A0ABP6SAH5_9ACTN
MRRGALVERDEFVGLGSRQTAAAPQKVVEAVPLGAVGCHEDVEVHGRLLLQALGPYGPYYCGALSVSLAD